MHHNHLNGTLLFWLHTLYTFIFATYLEQKFYLGLFGCFKFEWHVLIPNLYIIDFKKKLYAVHCTLFYVKLDRQMGKLTYSTVFLLLWLRAIYFDDSWITHYTIILSSWKYTKVHFSMKFHTFVQFVQFCKNKWYRFRCFYYIFYFILK